MKHSAIYAGTFDPITLGHLDLIRRASRIFERVILAVVVTSRKNTMFSIEERLAMARAAVGRIRNVEVDAFDGLLVEYARSRGVRVLLRGIRAFSDFEYEFQMALTNRNLAPQIETVFLLPKETHSYLSSSTVREILRHGGDVSRFVPPAVCAFMERRRAAERDGEARCELQAEGATS